jgi:hypothetical protein
MPGAPGLDFQTSGSSAQNQSSHRTIQSNNRTILQRLIRGVSLALCVVASLACAQAPISDRSHRTVAKAEAVEYLFPEQITVPAGSASPVTLHFRIRAGLHINSHTPREDSLTPTVLSFPKEAGVRLDAATYPAGADFTLPVDPGTRLSVYTGEFAIRARIVAPRGEHLVEAKLRYQACDQNACMPPKTITVPIDVIGN